MHQKTSGIAAFFFAAFSMATAEALDLDIPKDLASGIGAEEILKENSEFEAPQARGVEVPGQKTAAPRGS